MRGCDGFVIQTTPLHQTTKADQYRPTSIAEQVTLTIMQAVASNPTIIPDTREGMLRQIAICEENPENLIPLGLLGRMLKRALEL